MSLLRTIVDDISLKNNFFMVKTSGVRGLTLAQFDSVLVLLFEEELPALRVMLPNREQAPIHR